MGRFLTQIKMAYSLPQLLAGMLAMKNSCTSMLSLIPELRLSSVRGRNEAIGVGRNSNTDDANVRFPI